MKRSLPVIIAAIALTATSPAFAASKQAAPAIPLSDSGKKIEAGYAAALAVLKADIAKSLPAVSEQKRTALEKARAATRAAQKNADDAAKAFGAVNTAKALVEHAKGKWLGGAAKGIAAAEAAVKAATTDARRDAANKDLATWRADKEAGLKALAERQAALDKAKADEPRLAQVNNAAKAALAKASAEEMTAVKSLLADVDAALASDKLDAKLVRCVVLSDATPLGLAQFAQQGATQRALVEKLLGDDTLMRDMLVAGGAGGGKYGRAMEIYAAIQQASTKARDGALQRLALATALEFAVPVEQSNAQSQTGAPATVDPVNRYRHYERAFLAGELDAAFKDFTAWEYRMVVECDAPDEILTWGREMLRAYRPDHIATADYGWRYVQSVRTDVSYGSQNVSKDLPTLHNYQNIPLNGGVCGRRAFFGRFILRAFGIPVWGVTQHKHAAVSHWTPKGWVVNLGAGFNASWWDKDDAPRSGADFLLETQARAHGPQFLKVLRAQWVSRALGEQTYNDRKQIAGGFWSGVGHYQSVLLAAKSVALGPLGQELAEANEKKEKLEKVAATDADKRAVVGPGGVINIPAVAHGKASGSFATMKSFRSGQQMHCKGGFTAQYEFEAPQAGRYALTTRVATYEDGQKFQLAANESQQPIEAVLPFTAGLWQDVQPVEIVLAKGRNLLTLALPRGSRGVTVKDFTLKPVR
jgi:hypothetical protein